MSLIARPGQTLKIPVTTLPLGKEKSITWAPLMGSSDIVTVTQATPTTDATVTAKTGPGVDNNVTTLVGTLKDKWGVQRTVFLLVSVGRPIDDGDLSVLLETIREAQKIVDKANDDILNEKEPIYKPASLSALNTALSTAKLALDGPDTGYAAAHAALRLVLDGLEFNI